MDDITRDFTATTFIVDYEKTLLLWHRKLHAWLPPGGHIEKDELPEIAARREVREETGLDVELLGNHAQLGTVTLLRRPYFVLLEDIAPGHQHIDLIYFARVVGGQLLVNLTEATNLRWCSANELADPIIAEDIRILGRKAILACEEAES